MSPTGDLAFIARAVELATDPGEVGYHPRLFCQLALPYKDPGELAFWERRNGDFTLTVRPAVETAADGRRRVGYPFGVVPRLLLSWLATEVVRTREAELVLGDSLAAFMRALGMGAPTGGASGSITRLRRQMNRLFDASITAAYHGDPSRDVGHNFTIATAKSLWWSSADRNSGQGSLLPSTVRLSAEFYRELIEHPVPVDLAALRLLQASPLRLDIYAWLTHRASYARAASHITWGQLRNQFGSATATNTRQGRAKFRELFTRQLAYVLTVYPAARVDAGPDGLVLYPAAPHVARRSIAHVTALPSVAALPSGRRLPTYLLVSLPPRRW
jgi:hypothetical protein